MSNERSNASRSQIFPSTTTPLGSYFYFQVPLVAGDSVKVDLGVHIDGYVAIAAHTHIVPSAETAAGVALEPITGKQADVMNAAYIAAEVAARVIRPGNTNKQVTEAVKVVAETYGVQAIGGTLMHQVKRFVLDAAKVCVPLEMREVDQINAR